MIKIAYPNVVPKMRSNAEGKEIFCIVRKKWLKMSPEEWVRQNFILYLLHSLQYPLAMLSVEKTLHIAEVKKRYDLVVFSKSFHPVMVVEFKEMDIALSQQTILQILNYNAQLSANYLVVTNGIDCAAFVRAQMGFNPLAEIPQYEHIVS